MKIISAKINNFRLLKSVSLSFSTDSKKPLTVIRAANETGKTTCLNALTWCLYGSSALPNRGDYILFPADELKKHKKLDISVEIEFVFEQVRQSRGSPLMENTHYRMIRSCSEYAPVDNRLRRENEMVQLWEVKPSGVQRVLDSEVNLIINKALPESLKDVYFTDGDRAMSFIEAAASDSVKRRRVSQAIESLLGLDILDATIKHVTSAANSFSRQIDNTDYAKEYANWRDKAISYEEDIAEFEEGIEASSNKILDLDHKIELKSREIEEILVEGDRDALVAESKRVSNEFERIERALKPAKKELALLSSSENLSKSFLHKHIENAKELLNDMNSNNQLPKLNIPVLEELLDRDSCFCGSDLRQETSEGRIRRTEIEQKIIESQESDKVQAAATELYYSIRSADISNPMGAWMSSYEEKYGIVQNLNSSLANKETRLTELESSIASIADSNLQERREQLQQLKRDRDSAVTSQARNSGLIEEYKLKLEDAKLHLERLEKRLGKADTNVKKMRTANLTKQVFQKVVEKLKREELLKVSSEMNRIFMDMIGANEDSSQGGLIKGAKLTESFDIVVFGANGHKLNPDQDLNGASRRAITLAFILALTKVSEVEAPNIIDTPLGMMSGYVKQSVLLRTIEEGTQAVLFLTHDEIRGVEEIIDEYAGAIYTLTNPNHYPKMLVNKPSDITAGVTRCECNHKQNCVICARKNIEVA